ncbi:MAG: major facilitator transporter [Solirubrobacterales bacterium]|nr:major facilitator transporter [Solirubrobacterales bacterium]
MSAAPPPYRWTILAVGVVVAASYAAVRMGLPVLAPELRERYSLSLGGVGLLLGALALGQMLTTYAWGALADRRGERLVLGSGLIGASLALAAAALVDDVVPLVVALLFTGMLGASAVTASGRSVMGWFPLNERGTALGIRQMALPLGGAAAALALPALSAAFSMRAAFLALAAGMLVGGLVAIRWVREAPSTERDGSSGDGPSPLRDPRTWRMAACAACLLAAQTAILTFIVLFLHDARGVSVATAGACLAAIQVVGALARPTVGRLSDQSGLRIPLMRRIAVASAALFALSALVAERSSLGLTLAVLLSAGVLSMSWNGLSFTAAAEIAGPQRAGRALGVQTTIVSIGSGLMPPAYGLIVETAGWSFSFALLAVLQLVAAVGLGPLLLDELERVARSGEASASAVPSATVQA